MVLAVMQDLPSYLKVIPREQASKFSKIIWICFYVFISELVMDAMKERRPPEERF